MVKEVNCKEAGFDCEFMVRNENEDELVGFVQQHAEQTHDMSISRDDIRGFMKEA